MKTFGKTYRSGLTKAITTATLGLIFLFVTLAAAPEVHAQAAVKISTSLGEDAKSDSLYIGDPFTVTVEVYHSAGDVVKWPSVTPTMPLREGERRADAVLEILDRSETDSIFTDDGTVIVLRTFAATVFDAGEFTIPTWKFSLLTAGADEAQELRSQPVRLTIYAPQLDAADKPREIKDPLDIPFDWWPLLIAAVLGSVLILAAIFVWLRLRKRQAAPVEEPEVPRLIAPADKTALNALRALEKEELWQNGHVKQYYTRISEILRVYLEEQFGMTALESTSDEILEQLSHILMRSSEPFKSLRNTIQMADLVKFARTIPTAQDNENYLRAAYLFVENTRTVQPPGDSAAQATSPNPADAVAQVTSGSTDSGAAQPAAPGHAAFVPPNMRADLISSQSSSAAIQEPKNLADSGQQAETETNQPSQQQPSPKPPNLKWSRADAETSAYAPAAKPQSAKDEEPAADPEADPEADDANRPGDKQ